MTEPETYLLVPLILRFTGSFLKEGYRPEVKGLRVCLYPSYLNPSFRKDGVKRRMSEARKVGLPQHWGLGGGFLVAGQRFAPKRGIAVGGNGVPDARHQQRIVGEVVVGGEARGQNLVALV